MPAATILAAWVAFAAGGEPQVRAIIPSQQSCDSLSAKAGERDIVMEERSEPDQLLPVRTCQGQAPKDGRPIRLEGVSLHAPSAKPDRIVVLGDTGCRIKGPIIQDCNAPKSWPLAQLAQSAAAEKPDLVIHMGDYLYRETPCPNGDGRCSGSPYGDTWSAWKADFFDPAAPLLGAAPWIMVRGNHEDCKRGGHGWT